MTAADTGVADRRAAPCDGGRLRLQAIGAASSMRLRVTLPGAGGEAVFAAGQGVARPARHGAVLAEGAFRVQEDHQARGIAEGRR